MSGYTKLESICRNIAAAIKQSLGTNTDATASSSTGPQSMISLTKSIRDSTATSATDITAIQDDIDDVIAGTSSFSVRGDMVSVLATFERPNDTAPYIALDVVSNSTSAPTTIQFTVTAGFEGYITYASLQTDNTALTARFRLHLFNDTVTAINDNSPFTLLFANASKYLGSIDFPASATEGSGSTGTIAQNDLVRLPVVGLAGTTIYGILETLDAYTPVALTDYTVILRIARI